MSRHRRPWVPRVLLLGLVMLGAAVLADSVLWPWTRVGVLSLLRLAPVSCDHALGRWSALVRGVLPDDPICRKGLDQGPWGTRLLQALVEDVRWPSGARQTAMALLGPARAPMQRVLDDPRTPPNMRLDALLAMQDGEIEPDDVVHGLYDFQSLILYQSGEANSLWPAWGALRELDPARRTPAHALALAGLGVTAAELERGRSRHLMGQNVLDVPAEWRDAFWKHDCAPDCTPLLLALMEAEARRLHEERPPVPSLPTGDGVIEGLYAADPIRGDHIRSELLGVAKALTERPRAQQADWLVGALLPAESYAAGDLHDALAGLGGAPAVLGFGLEWLGGQLGLDVRLWATERGIAARVDAQFWQIDACAAPKRVIEHDDAWQPLPEGTAGALALLWAAQRALESGAWSTAQAQIEQAAQLWADAPGMAGATATMVALRALEAPAVLPTVHTTADAQGVSGPDRLYVHRPPLPRRPEPLDARAASRAAILEQASHIRARAGDARTLTLVAFWAARAGNADLARELLPGPQPGSLWPQVARWLGEPVTYSVAPVRSECLPAFRGL